ncbi:MAG: GNAT family N-acetyltransferase, partial [Actinobacteria bacterium]|nr:GNAT family N-acetyltransferase [Actinomycetota bacterium]
VDAPAVAASAAAARAARGVDVEVVELDGLQRLEQASSLFGAVWSTPGDHTQMPVNILRAVASAGGFVAGACRSGALVGAIVGFLGVADGDLLMHSHICGVLPQARAGVGFALKQHQRAWALARGIQSVTWTFDPLVRRNAYFNLVKLGAGAARYETNYYGAMRDAINAEDDTDRLVAVWDLESPRACAAAERLASPLDPAASGNATVALDLDDDQRPVVRTARGEVLVCRVPYDIVALRAVDRRLGARWRAALRDTLGTAMGDGYCVEGFTSNGS